jgi:hypothetical protein
MIEQMTEYWVVECGECYESIPVKRLNRINDDAIPHNLPEEFTVEHAHPNTFHRGEAIPRSLPHILTKDLPKITEK